MGVQFEERSLHELGPHEQKGRHLVRYVICLDLKLKYNTNMSDYKIQQLIFIHYWNKDMFLTNA
jgi:hypothetical protein